jgi:hypothetical protein
LLTCLLAVLLITAGIPVAGISAAPSVATASESVATASASDEVTLHDLNTWVAPSSADLSNRSTVVAAAKSGNLNRSETVTPNDTLVLELRASGLEGVLDGQNGSNATERFFGLLEDPAFELRIEQRNPPPSLATAEIHLAEYDSTRVVTDPVNDSYYLVVDPAATNVTRGTREAELRPGQEYEANFSLAGSSALAANGTESATTNFVVVEPAAELSTAGAEREFAVPAPNQTISGTTTLPPGSEVTVELRLADGDRRFAETVRVQYDSDGVGRFGTAFDFSDVPDGTNLTADVRAESYPDLGFDATHVVVAEPTARAEIGTVTANGVSLDATLSHGGFVAVHRDSPDGELLGYSHLLDPEADESAYVNFVPDLESNATLVAVAYRDADRDGEFDPEVDEPYVSGDSAVAEAVEFTVETTTTAESTDEGTTTIPSTTLPTTDAPMPDETTGNSAGETTDPENDGLVPGFGMGISVFALLVGLLFAKKRR